MQRSLLLAGVSASLILGLAGSASAQRATTTTTTTTAAAPQNQAQIDELQRQIQTMTTQLDYMRRQMELMQDKYPPKPPAGAATAAVTNGRPQLSSFDGNFKFNIQARSHTDFGNYFGLPTGLQMNNGVNQRRGYLSLNSTFYKDFDSILELDFGNSANENKTTGYLRTAELTWNGANSGLGNFKFEFGYFEPQSSFERATSSNNVFLIERASDEQIAAGFAADDRRFSVGVRDNGNNWYGNLYYTGARTAVGNTDNIRNEQSAFIGRLAFLPYQDADTGTYIHVGVNGQAVLSPNELASNQPAPRRTLAMSFRPGLNIDNQSFISTGNISANSGSVIGGELAAEWKNVAVFAQSFHYMVDAVNPVAGVSAADVSFDGFDITAGYVVTGERRGYDKTAGSYGAVVPAKPFNPGTGDWGALELVARFEQTNLNDRNGNYIVEGGRQTLYEVGANWYLNRNIRVMLDYIYAEVRRAAVVGNGTPTARLTWGAPGSNLQPAFNAIAARTQFNF